MQAFGLGRIGRDAELRRTPNGDPVASFSVAFSYGRKGDDGYRPTQWVDASLWGKRAESLAQHLLKGGLVAVTLEDVHIQTYKGAKGEGYKLVGRVSEIELAGGSEKQATTKPAAEKAQSKPVAPASGGFNDVDEDIPWAPMGYGRLCMAM